MRGESHGGLCCEEQRVESKLCPVVMYIVHQRCDRRSDRVKIIGMALQSQKKVVQLYRELNVEGITWSVTIVFTVCRRCR